ncbi:MAG: hypothetical protein IJS44_01005 [Clostridia bacterium]|nr:hypothetical protein [Clostridia bacterium]
MKKILALALAALMLLACLASCGETAPAATGDATGDAPVTDNTAKTVRSVFTNLLRAPTAPAVSRKPSA